MADAPDYDAVEITPADHEEADYLGGAGGPTTVITYYMEAHDTVVLDNPKWTSPDHADKLALLVVVLLLT